MNWELHETNNGYRTWLLYVGTQGCKYLVARIEEMEQFASGQGRYSAGPSDPSKTVWAASVLERTLLRDPYVSTYQNSQEARLSCEARMREISRAVLA